jgi:hypothetical protein
MRMKIVLLTVFLLLLIKTTVASPLSLDYHTVPENPSPGIFVLKLSVTNLGNDITNVEVFVSEREEGLAIIENGREVSYTYISLGGLPQGTATAELKLRAYSSGLYGLNVDVRANSSESIRNTIIIKVYDIPSFSTSGSIEIVPSTEKDFSIEIKNNGGRAEDVSIQLRTPEGIAANRSKFFFNEWSGGEVKSIAFKLLADKNINVGIYSAFLEMTYTDGFGNFIQESMPLALRVVGDAELVISVDGTEPERIYPDMEFFLKLAIENTGFQEAENVRVRLVLPEDFKGETEKLLGSLKKKESKDVSFALKSGSNSGLFPFEVELSYGQERKTEKFNLFVSERGEISLDIAGVFTSPQEISPGEKFKLSLQLENSGKQDAKAVSVRLLLPEGMSGKNTYFIGSLESGDSATASFDLISEKTGERKIEAVISYMDQKFGKYEIKKEFSIYIFEDSEIMPGIALFAALVIITLLVLWKWKKRG